MKPKRQSVIQHVLVLLVALAMPHIASADDPCEGSDDAVLKFVSSLPRLSSEDLRRGKFSVEDMGREFLIRYQAKGRSVYQGSISNEGDITIQPISVGSYSALFYAFDTGGNGCCSCYYVVAPSLRTGRFLLIPHRPIFGTWKPWQQTLPNDRVRYYQEKDRACLNLLYKPFVEGKGQTEYLGYDGTRYIKYVSALDIDCDGETELITSERQDWYLDCGFSTAEFPVYNLIYHLSPERHELYEVSTQFPKVYADLGDWLRENQNSRVGTPTEKSPRCEAEVQRLINEARKMASAGGTGRKSSCSGDSGEIIKLSPFLSFPLECGDKNCKFRYTNGAYTPKSINSVLDHHMDYSYKEDGVVLAFTGEEGRGTAVKGLLP